MSPLGLLNCLPLKKFFKHTFWLNSVKFKNLKRWKMFDYYVLLSTAISTGATYHLKKISVWQYPNLIHFNLCVLSRLFYTSFCAVFFFIKKTQKLWNRSRCQMMHWLYLHFILYTESKDDDFNSITLLQNKIKFGIILSHAITLW